MSGVRFPLCPFLKLNKGSRHNRGPLLHFRPTRRAAGRQPSEHSHATCSRPAIPIACDAEALNSTKKLNRSESHSDGSRHAARQNSLAILQERSILTYGNSGKLQRLEGHARGPLEFSTARIVPKILYPSMQQAELFFSMAYTMAALEDRCQDIRDCCPGQSRVNS